MMVQGSQSMQGNLPVQTPQGAMVYHQQQHGPPQAVYMQPQQLMVPGEPRIRTPPPPPPPPGCVVLGLYTHLAFESRAPRAGHSRSVLLTLNCPR